ncbi:MAG: SPFH domain-containing protein [Phycisphaerales bacterium]|nr:SPFH domain-containing protein [Phycisphaerales bacterium]
MRVDHHACQRATNTAVTGLIIQIAIAMTLLVFGLVAGSTAFVFASFFAWISTVVWLGLIILFYQQKMQLLEVLEESELSGGDPSAFFETSGNAIRPAANRLQLLYKWVMPGLSLFAAAALIVIAIALINFLRNLEHQDDILQTFISQTSHIGWALATSMAFALVNFIFSRFVAGMANIPAWSNLRGGSAWMVGNAIILLVISVGLFFRFFENDQVLLAVCWGIPIFMLAVAAEVCINFVLNLYRPRIHGESPRPAFDSKTLSLFASPDSLVRSLNEAINYQFGFDITSSWGYQLLIRSAIWLFSLGAVALLAMSALVVVEPTEQAVRLRQGKIIGDVQRPGLMFKLPWPLESSIETDITRVRDLQLTFKWKEKRNVILWTDDLFKMAVVKPKPFIVNDGEGNSVELDNDLLALVDIRAVLQYRIAQDGLLNWLHFGSDDVERRSRLTYREMAIKAISQKALTGFFQQLELDDVIGSQRGNLSKMATALVQASLDEQHAGIQVLSVDLPMVAPAGTAAGSFEELSVAMQGEMRLRSAANGQAESLLTHVVGDASLVDSVVDAVHAFNDARVAWDALRRADGTEEKIALANKEMLALQQEAIKLIKDGYGSAAATIRSARVERWTTLMDTWSSASRVSGQMAAYRAAPELYMQRMYMSVLARRLPAIRKYVIGIDPNRVQLDVELRSINPLLNFADSLESDEEGN